MKPCFVCTYVVLASTLLLAQGKSTSFSARKSLVHSQSTSGQGLSFASPATYGTGGYASTSVAIGDVNGDGKPDLVVASCPNNTIDCPGTGLVGVLLGNGDGTFKTAVTYSSGGEQPKSVAIADVNGDGKPDLVVANQCASPCVSQTTHGSVGVLLGNGDGTFQPVVTYDSGGVSAESVAAADMNGDGKLDIVVADSDLVGVLLGNGNGTFQTAVTYNSGAVTFGPFWVALGDLNGDGEPDVVVAQDDDIGVLLNNGDGTLQTAVLYSGGAPQTVAVALADLRGDGKLDALVANTGKPFDVGVLLGNGDGTFQPVVAYGTNDQYAGPFMVAAADMNGDGKLDLVMPNQGSCIWGISVLPGNGDGTFQSDVDFCLSQQATDVAVADLNGDGMPDVAATIGSTVTVLINTSTTAVVSPASLGFASQAPGSKSSQQTVTLTNIATAALPISGISITGTDATSFSQTNNCASSLAANASCQINVASDPQTGGALSATLQVSDDASGSPQTIPLTGTGEDFSVSASPTSNTVTPGQAANYTLTVAPLSGFSQKVALSCSGAPAGSTCTISPSSVTLNGTANETASVAIVTAGSSAHLPHPLLPSQGDRLALWLGLTGLPGLFLLSGSDGRKQRVRWLRTLSLLGVMSLIIIWPACGGGSGSSVTPAGNYTVTVTGTYTSGSVTLTHTTNLKLVVN